uniref:Putative 4-carboxymuconolactone decarboxylase n=1 Tax=termite gut metagenome TaxID=433724 RepID=S0DG02_9ZZZZ
MGITTRRRREVQEMDNSKTTAGRDALGSFAPKFAELNDDVLFGQVWAREEQLSPRDRSLLTITALVAGGVLDTSLQHHIRRGKDNGITKDEMAEALTHLAFYAGWPRAWAAFRMAVEIYGEAENGI